MYILTAEPHPEFELGSMESKGKPRPERPGLAAPSREVKIIGVSGGLFAGFHMTIERVKNAPLN